MFKRKDIQQLEFESGLILQQYEIDELGTKLYYFKPRPKKQKQNDFTDGQENCVSFAFYTPADNSTGMQHILEHSVLAGSESFPLKDLFATLIARGSVNKDLNAYTADTYTVYHFTSDSYQDTINLTTLHLDALFHPASMRDERAFRQEGWRYYLDQNTGKLEYRGVVYSEMCSAYSSPDELAGYEIERMLFRGTNLENNPHGNPLEIIKLTYEQYKEYHKHFYTLSNCTIVIVSSQEPETFLCDLEKIIQKINIPLIQEQVIQSQNTININSIQTHENEIPCDIEDIDKHTFYRACLGKSLYEISAQEFYTLFILNKIMHTIPGNLFQRQLVEKHLCESFSSERIIKQKYLYTQLNIQKYELKNEQNIMKIVNSIYHQYLTNDYINTALFDATINSVLIDQLNRHEDQNQLFVDDFLSYTYAKLSIQQIYDLCNIKTCLNKLLSLDMNQKRKLIKDVIETYYLNATSILYLRPNPSLQLQQQQELESKLQNIIKQLSYQELQDIVSMENKITSLAQQNDDPELVKKLPKLSFNDIIPILNRWNDINYQTIDNKFNFVKTDEHLVMFKIIFYPKLISLEQLQYLNLLIQLIGDLRTVNYTLEQLQVEMLQCVDAFEADTYETNTNVAVTFSYNCLSSTAEKATNLFMEIIRNTLLQDYSEIRSVIYDIKNNLQDKLNDDNCNYYARYLSHGTVNKSGIIMNALDGYGYYKFISGLSIFKNEEQFNGEEKYEECSENSSRDSNSDSQELSEMKELVNRLQTVYDDIFSNIDAMILVSANPNDIDVVYRCVKILEEKINDKKFNITTQIPNQNQFMNLIQVQSESQTIKTQQSVNYIAKSLQISQLNSQILLICHILSSQYLWDKIRIRGGAYYVNASVSALNTLTVQSGSDPNYKQTVKIMDGIYNYLKTFYIDEEELQQVKIAAVSAYQPPQTQSGILNIIFKNIIQQKSSQWIYSLYKGIIDVTIKEIQDSAKLFETIDKSPIIGFIGVSQYEHLENQK